jgi:hypothetical protein
METPQASGWKVKIEVKVTGGGPTPGNLRTYLTRRLKKCGMTKSETNTWITPDLINPDQARAAVMHALEILERPWKSVGWKARWKAETSHVSVEIEKH